MSTSLDWSQETADIRNISKAQITPAIYAQLSRLRQQVGHTPAHKVQNLYSHPEKQVFAKKEWLQISGSVKARAAFQIIESALLSGVLHAGKTLLDATSGNTGIAYAAIARELGIKVTLCLPENASKERKEILQTLGAELILTSRFEGTDGAQEVARDLFQQYPDKYFYADQYNNENNWKAHFEHTAAEIVLEFPEITHFVAALGSTGTFTGTGRRLKELVPHIQLIALQPDTPMHGLEGWKHLETAVVPGIYAPQLADEVLEINTSDAYQMMRDARAQEGLHLSPSSAANLLGAIQVAKRIEKGVVVSILPDNADKYSEIIEKLN
jgi:cysteine synthase B